MRMRRTPTELENKHGQKTSPLIMRSTTRGTRVPGASAHLPAATRRRGCHAAPLAAVACVLLLATCAAAFGPAGVHEAFNVSTQSK